MKRALVITALMAAAVVAVVLVARSVTNGPGTYRFAAIFDDAEGMVPGQQVKIAGAVVGNVRAVDLDSSSAEPKARMVLAIESRFAPLKAGTTCTILPEGLISEDFVQCTPGRSSDPLASGPGGLPTVPLADTTVPFSLQDVLNVFSMPTDQRLGLLISELGIATAGRGEDINALLRRADPALQQSQRALGILDAQRARLATAVGQTDQVLSALASRSESVRRFVDDAATVARTTAAHAGPLGQAINRLPAMLAAVRPGLAALDSAARNATPLLTELQLSAPGLDRLTSVLPSFAHAGGPALRTLASAARSGIPAVRAAAPIVSQLLSSTGPLKTLAASLDQLLVSSRDTGAFEGTLRVAYAFATNTALYDNVSHILTFIASVDPECIAGQQADIAVPGCSHKYNGPDQGMIPVNEPSCGPKNPSWFNETCPIAAPGPVSANIRTAAARSPQGQAKLADLDSLANQALEGHDPSKQAFRSLLDFLLK